MGSVYVAERSMSRCPRTSAAELFFEDAIDRGRVRLALALLHHLSDEEAEELVLARAVLGHLLGVSGDDAVDHLDDRAFVGHLHEALAVDDRARVVRRADKLREDLLGDLAADRAVV